MEFLMEQKKPIWLRTANAPVVMNVSPQQASIWLQSNQHNRPINEATVAFYAKEMLAGKWRLMGQAIIFSKSGKLLNGQHRLMACVRSGKIIPASVVFDMDEQTFFNSQQIPNFRRRF
jgi:hypothetical protein